MIRSSLYAYAFPQLPFLTGLSLIIGMADFSGVVLMAIADVVHGYPFMVTHACDAPL